MPTQKRLWRQCLIRFRAISNLGVVLSYAGSVFLVSAIATKVSGAILELVRMSGSLRNLYHFSRQVGIFIAD
ncbi:hypothetical protein PM04_01870 [Thalassobacter sp. 16PALIMAR09]|nr:hypothetical protein PM04_01870 [Thalassobacter sp. 16PALIMAR09]